MPTYDYRCTACGHEVEVVHGIHDSGPSTCDVCGGLMRKALSRPAIHFRGGGWAKMDARTASSTKAAGAAAPASAGKDASSGDAGGASTSTGSTGDSGATGPTTSGDGAGGTSKGTTSANSAT